MKRIPATPWHTFDEEKSLEVAQSTGEQADNQWLVRYKDNPNNIMTLSDDDFELLRQGDPGTSYAVLNFLTLINTKEDDGQSES